jgi:hypothetical protein
VTFPDDLHSTFSARAALRGVPLSEYLRGLLARAASRPTPEEVASRIASREPVELPEPSAVSVRRLRAQGE